MLHVWVQCTAETYFISPEQQLYRVNGGGLSSLGLSGVGLSAHTFQQPVSCTLAKVLALQVAAIHSNRKCCLCARTKSRAA